MAGAPFGRWAALVDLSPLIGAIEGKRGDFHVETVPGAGFHLIGTDHNAGRCRKRRAAGVFERLAGRQHGLFADHAVALHFLDITQGIGDPPMPGQQLNRFLAVVFDPASGMWVAKPRMVSKSQFNIYGLGSRRQWSSNWTPSLERL